MNEPQPNSREINGKEQVVIKFKFNFLLFHATLQDSFRREQASTERPGPKLCFVYILFVDYCYCVK